MLDQSNGANGASDAKLRGPKTGIRAAQRDRTRAAIVESAIKVFAEVGFDAAQTRAIATRAKVNRGLLHYYFSSKLKLWKACVDYLHDRAYGAGVLDAPAPALDQLSDLDHMRTVIRKYVEFSVEHPEWARIMTAEAKRPSARLDYLIEHHLRAHSEWLHELFRRLQDQGHMPRISPVVMQYMFWGMANTLFTMAPEVKRKLGVDPTKDDDLIQEQVRAIELLLLGSSSKAGPAHATRSASERAKHAR